MRVLAYVWSFVCACMCVCVQLCFCACVFAMCMHTCIRKRVHKCVRKCVSVWVGACGHVCVRYVSVCVFVCQNTSMVPFHRNTKPNLEVAVGQCWSRCGFIYLLCQAPASLNIPLIVLLVAPLLEIMLPVAKTG